MIAVALPVFFTGSKVTSDGEGKALSTGLGTVEGLEANYKAWEVLYEKSGADRNMTLSISAAKGLTGAEESAYGEVRLDWVEGKVTVEVNRLSKSQGWDLWLIDNSATSSILPDESDTMLRVGGLTHNGDLARLEADLGPDAFDSFEPDLVIVTHAGKSPVEDRVLAGTTTLFQRLYRSKQKGQFGMLADFQPASEPAPEQSFIEKLVAAVMPTAEAQIGPIPNTATPLEQLITAGRQSFLNDTFEGNGRTCATCHREENNMTIDPEFIATLPIQDPLFVAETQPALAANFENPRLMRNLGLILENVDGLDDLPNKFVMRGVPHTLALIPNTLNPAVIDGTTIPPNERTGWSGDGAPVVAGGGPALAGTLRSFIIGAITQHYPKTLARQVGSDFIMPTVAQLDALEAFQKSTGRQADIKLAGPGALSFKNPIVSLGRDIFNNPGDGLPPFVGNPNVAAGRCLLCHFNAGAGDLVEAVIIGGSTPDPALATNVNANANFDTGVEAQPAQPADLLVPPNQNPPDGGFGTALRPDGGFGNGTFNTPVLVEAADTGPFFHNNSIETIEGAVAFYNSNSFNNSPIGAALPGGIRLEATEIVAVAAFLRVINALENIRSSVDLENRAKNAVSFGQAQELLRLSIAELDDAKEVLDCGGLHPEAQLKLLQAAALDALALVTSNKTIRNAIIDQAIALKRSARADLVN
ncbi:MAG TPA: hypothetical protein VFQ92_13160 [Blastocatellia bacterium]|nr:hypothetical protein [Blastocatellia bacterium]